MWSTFFFMSNTQALVSRNYHLYSNFLFPGSNSVPLESACGQIRTCCYVIIWLLFLIFLLCIICLNNVILMYCFKLNEFWNLLFGEKIRSKYRKIERNQIWFKWKVFRGKVVCFLYFAMYVWIDLTNETHKNYLKKKEKIHNCNKSQNQHTT